MLFLLLYYGVVTIILYVSKINFFVYIIVIIIKLMSLKTNDLSYTIENLNGFFFKSKLVFKPYDHIQLIDNYATLNKLN